jgi:hypothetical protein
MQVTPEMEGCKEIFTPYITKNGKRIYHPRYFTDGTVYHFWIKPKLSG